MLNVAQFPESTARRSPAALAVVHEGRRYNYRQLNDLIGRVAKGLALRRYGPGDRIALCCCNRPGFLAAYYGALKIGATVVVLSASIRKRDLLFQLRDSGARALLVFDGFGDTAFAEMAIEAASEAEACRDIWVIPKDPLAASPLAGARGLGDLMASIAGSQPTWSFADQQTAVIIYTSGSTGRPKGVELTQRNLVSLCLINQSLARRDATAVRMVVTPLYHIAGQIAGLNLPVLNGETMVLVERFEAPAVWRQIVDEGATYLFHMPIYYKWLLDDCASVPASVVRKRLRLCLAGGSPLPVAWAQAFRERFGLPLLPSYGTTEVTAMISWNSPYERIRYETVGRPVVGVEVRIADESGRFLHRADEGEVMVRSPGVMKGYLNLPELNAEVLRDGWYRTRDVGRLDDEGYLHLLGRADDKIKRGEEHIYPAEIENVLLEHPAVAQAAVVAIPDDDLGQEAKTMVVLKPGSRLRRQDLLSWMAAELPVGKCPGLLEFRADLPRSAAGKTVRHHLA